MSPGPTFERVYLELKRQLREGTRPPGTPLEPTAIGDELGTSFTPVRDALHRLVGEGLVDTPRHNGFAVPHPTDQALRDLYAWSGEIVGLIAARKSAPLLGEDDASVAEQTEALFLALVDASGNREHKKAVAQLNERLAPFRRAEPALLPDLAEELAALRAVASNSPRADLVRSVARYHKRRVALVPQLLATMPRDK